MSELNNNINSTVIYIGIDAHTTNYNISFLNSTTGEIGYENRLPADNAELVKYIKRIKKRHYSNGDYEFVVGYEAGYTGYKTARYLKENGIDCIILAPNTIKRSAKQKRFKNDVADARLIAQTLRNRDYSKVLVPTPEEESVDHLLKDRQSVRGDLTKNKNRLSAILTPKGFKSEHAKWSEPYLGDVDQFINEESLDLDVFVMRDLLDEINHQEKRLRKIEAKIDEFTQEVPNYQDKVKQLCSLKGISTLTALTMIAAAKDITRFKTADQFVNYLGLAPGDNSSGKKTQKLGITKNGNPRYRTLLVEAASTYCRGSAYYKTNGFLKGLQGLDPELQEYAIRAYERLHKKYRHLHDDLHKAHNICICAVARELACFVWGILSGNIK